MVTQVGRAIVKVITFLKFGAVQQYTTRFLDKKSSCVGACFIARPFIG